MENELRDLRAAKTRSAGENEEQLASMRASVLKERSTNEDLQDQLSSAQRQNDQLLSEIDTLKLKANQVTFSEKRERERREKDRGRDRGKDKERG